MEIIETRISTASDEYKANYAQMERLVAELKAEMKKAREDRSEKALGRNAELGKLPVQKRLDLLLDRNALGWRSLRSLPKGFTTERFMARGGSAEELGSSKAARS